MTSERHLCAWCCLGISNFIGPAIDTPEEQMRDHYEVYGNASAILRTSFNFSNVGERNRHTRPFLRNAPSPHFQHSHPQVHCHIFLRRQHRSGHRDAKRHAGVWGEQGSPKLSYEESAL